MREVLAALGNVINPRNPTGGCAPPATGGGQQARTDPYLEAVNSDGMGVAFAVLLRRSRISNPYEVQQQIQLPQQQLATMRAMQAQCGYYPPQKPTVPGETPMLEKLKNLQHTLSSNGVDELVALSAFGRSLFSEYAALSIPVPAWLADNHALLTAEIATRYRAARLAELKKAEKDLEELRSREEKKVATEEKLAALRSELGFDVVKPLPLPSSQAGT